MDVSKRSGLTRIKAELRAYDACKRIWLKCVKTLNLTSNIQYKESGFGFTEIFKSIQMEYGSENATAGGENDQLGHCGS